MNSRVDCPACGKTVIPETRLVEDFEYRIPYKAAFATCLECRTTFQCPMPDLEKLSSFYPSNYHSQTNKGFMNQVRNRMRLNRLKNFISKGDTILDYGCGNGAFIAFAAESIPDCNFYGYELSTTSEVTELNTNAKLIKGSFEDLMKLLPNCRLITMNHVIEHLPDPFSVISELHSNLAAGGVLEGQTPAAGSLEQRVFGEKWSGYHAPRHTVVFSSGGLDSFLKRVGFSSVETTPALNPAGIGVSLASLVQRNGIRREGMRWLFWIGLATCFAPIDLLSGSPGIINFLATKNGS